MAAGLISIMKDEFMVTFHHHLKNIKHSAASHGLRVRGNRQDQRKYLKLELRGHPTLVIRANISKNLVQVIQHVRGRSETSALQ